MPLGHVPVGVEGDRPGSGRRLQGVDRARAAPPEGARRPWVWVLRRVKVYPEQRPFSRLRHVRAPGAQVVTVGECVAVRRQQLQPAGVEKAWLIIVLLAAGDADVDS